MAENKQTKKEVMNMQFWSIASTDMHLVYLSRVFQEPLKIKKERSSLTYLQYSCLIPSACSPSEHCWLHPKFLSPLPNSTIPRPLTKAELWPAPLKEFKVYQFCTDTATQKTPISRQGVGQKGHKARVGRGSCLPAMRPGAGHEPSCANWVQ